MIIKEPNQTWVQPVCVQRPLLAEQLDLVDDLRAAVIPLSRVSLRILVAQARPLRHEGGATAKVLRRDQLDAGLLADLFLLDELPHLCNMKLFLATGKVACIE